MSSFDKVVKLACKPKAAPPKAKYLDPIVAATWSEDGAVHDVCKALVPRLREPNAIVVFKALIVLHTMIRNGATDNVLSHLSSSEVLRLRNVSAGNWEGYNAPQNMQHYALYLDSRIRAYRELKHDAVRVQAETNRDMRVNHSIEEDMAYTTAPPKASSTTSKGPQRSKTIMGRKLRVMTVEKGLLRETKTVQKMIDSLVECRFYLDDLEDELTITALRMLVKDLLILFQAGNEGVINVLEHYFEMSKYDAEEALDIYRRFCSQTERVVEYLGVAKKLQNLLNVPIPNLKHAPVSLASSLQEYLNDPNFEQNRIEYKANKEAADRNAKGRNGTASSAPPPNKASSPQATPAASSNTSSSSPPGASSKIDTNQTMADFFNCIEEEQMTISNPATGSPTNNYFPQQTAHNPFVQRQLTGAFTSHSFGFPGPVQMQPTGFPASQPFQIAQSSHSAQSFQFSQTMAFGAQPQQQAPQHRPFSTFLPPQPTGLQSGPAAGFLQPQVTGANPFRQSMLIPQTTGMAPFNVGGITPTPQTSATQTNSPFQITSTPQLQSFGQPFGQLGQPQQPTSSGTPLGQTTALTPSDIPARPASTPLTSFGATLSPHITPPIQSHQTGSRNPFGVPVTPAPSVPKPPTLFELSMGFGNLGLDGSQSALQQSQQTGAINSQASTAGAPASTISSVASSFASAKKPDEKAFPSFGGFLNGPGASVLSTSTATSGSTTSDSLFSSPPLSSQPTGATVISSVPSISVSAVRGPLKPQTTGFSGIKPFKPTSNFGASLLESLPPIPRSDATTPDTTSGPTASHLSTPSLPTNLILKGSGIGQDSSALGGMNPQPTGAPGPSAFQKVNGGSILGVGLRPQATGALGAANPFRATMFAATASPSAVNGTSNMLMPFSASTPPFGGLSNGTGGLSSLGAGLESGAFASSFSPTNQAASKLSFQQQNAGASLI
ncbi:ANTH-domain-containing protein [Gyrodon lividus]|nr:ANTH-domain-containing protein [Gyrodon lividus]